jgi:hypothetical protein
MGWHYGGPMRELRGLILAGAVFLAMTRPVTAASSDLSANEGDIYTPALPALADFAKGAGIRTEGIELADLEETGRPGDSVVLLLTSFDRKGYEQWIAVLSIEELTEAEMRKKPPFDIVLNTITGQVLRYPGGWSAVGIRIVGPFHSRPGSYYFSETTDKRSRALVRTSFLSLGFDRACVFILRSRDRLLLPESGRTTGVDPQKIFKWSRKPFPPQRVEEGRRLAAQIGMTPEDERLIGGVSPALAAFLRVVEKVPGMPEMVMHVVDFSALWSILREGRLEAGFVLQTSRVELINPNPWSLPIGVYRLPFELRFNDKPVLDCALAVAAPRRPLLTSAGVLGIAASNPENRERRLAVRVLSTHATHPGSPAR